MPGEYDELTDQEKATVVSIVDAFPANGAVTILEFKRFCKQVAKSGMTMLDFVRSLTEGG
jgi:hypothetical protein